MPVLLACEPSGTASFGVRHLFVFVLVLLGACTSESLAPLPLKVAIEASRITAAPGDSITFEVTAQGGQVIGLTTTYGDGTSDQVATFGARTARVTFRHAFSAPGTYQVQATVTDAVAGMKDASVEIRVN